jgi:hypothetical protein
MEDFFPNKILHSKKVFLAPKMSPALLAIRVIIMRQKTGFEGDGNLQ